MDDLHGAMGLQGGEIDKWFGYMKVATTAAPRNRTLSANSGFDDLFILSWLRAWRLRLSFPALLGTLGGTIL